MNTLLNLPSTTGRDRWWSGRLPLISGANPVWAFFALLLLLFIYCGPFLRWLDPVAAVVDIGVLSLSILAGLLGLGFVAAGRWLLGLLWPVFRDFNKHHFEPIFKSLLPWQKIVIYLSCFFLLLYAWVLVLWAVMG